MLLHLKSLAFLSTLGFPELIVILLIAVLLFGARRLPEIARSMGKAMNEFKKGIKEVEKDVSDSQEDVQDTKKV